jgi:hypothetical protein
MTKESPSLNEESGQCISYLVIRAFFSHYDLGLRVLPSNRSIKPVASRLPVW